MRTSAVCAVAGAAFCVGLGLGIAVVQFRLAPAWRVVSGVEMHLLHTDFTPNWPMLHKQELYKGNPSPMPIVMAGDSLTDYADWSELLRRPDVGNRGITGDTSLGLLQRASMLAKPGATIAVMIGENDLAEHRTVEAVCSNIARVVDVLQVEHRVVLQATLLTSAPTLNGEIKDLDACEHRLCDRSQGCTFLDLNPRLAPEGTLAATLSFDGFHLNHDGYVQWAAALGPVLERVSR